ncbi:MauE/DoxX family redox-associated membrane protein [Plantactinospora sp. DSM 117369]
MGVDGLLFVSLNALLVAVLLVAGVTKTVVPQPVRRAVEELFDGSANTVSTAAVRVFGVAEVLIGLGLLIPAARAATGFAVVGLGVLFALAGAAGRWRRSALPCGCLGGGPYPLGARNVLVGAAFVALGVLDVVAVPSGPAPEARAPAITAAATVLLCLWLHRRLAWRLLRPSTRPDPT